MKRSFTALTLALAACTTLGQAPTSSVSADAGKHGTLGDNPIEFNATNTPGWAMMTPEERLAYRNRMQGFTSYTECKAFYDQHTRQMQARAVERKLPFSGQQMDPCITLQ
jgi:hypothetical protein